MKALLQSLEKTKRNRSRCCSESGKVGLNIDDISQTVLDEYFTMMAVVSSDEKEDFTLLRSELENSGQSL